MRQAHFRGFISLTFTDLLGNPISMYYCAYKGRTIDILKCSQCRAYSIELTPSSGQGSSNEWVAYDYLCGKCSAKGSVKISSRVTLEGFKTWEELQERIDELKVAMTISGLE